MKFSITLKQKAKSIRLKAVLAASAVLAIGSNAFAQSPVISYGTPPAFSLNKTVATLTPANSGGAVSINGQTITLAGSGTAGHVDGTGTVASFNHPSGLAHDAAGNVYVGDAWDNCIRKITPAGVVTTLAGNGTAGFADGIGTAAQFNQPYGVAVDPSGNVYVADYVNSRIRVISPAGVVTTLAGNSTAGYADGTGTAASFNHPTGVALDAAGNLYVADSWNNMIRKVTPSGVVTTLAGSTTAGSVDGSGTAARFNRPFGLTTDPWGNIFVADWYNFTIRKITPNGAATTFAGSTTHGATDATGTAARFYYPAAITSDAAGNLYVADEYNNKVRKITQAAVVTTLSGTGTQGAGNGIGNAATFYYPLAITCDATGYLYVAEYSNNLVRKVAMAPYGLNVPLSQGLTFNAGTGAISGTPAAIAASGTYNVTAYGSTANSTAALTLAVNASPLSLSNAQNYVATYIPRVSGITDTSTLRTASGDANQVQTAVAYIDGLGRPLQTVQVKGSATGNDLVQPFAYDTFGRDSVSYLPYSVNTASPGSYQSAALSGSGGYTGSAQYSFYQQSGLGYVNTTCPYAGTNYEPSPLNRVVEKGAPGTSWQLITSGVSGSGHTAKVDYSENNSTSFGADSVKGMQAAWYNATVNSSGSRTLVANSYYPANTLSVTITKDENWVSGRAGTVEEYKDLQGHVVLKRQYNYTGSAVQMLSTYYVYDDFDQLAFVLPPASGADAAGTISQTTLSNLCYQYQYDDHGRMSGKKIPGKGWEYTVFNIADRPVATQDSLQRAANQWVFSKYDGMGRPVITGLWNNGGTAISQSALQASLTAITTNLWEAPAGTTNGYSNVSWPTSNVTSTLTTDYYDSYSAIPGLPATYSATGASVQTRGLPVAKLTAVLNTPTDQLWDVLYYDDLGRMTKAYNQHYLGGTVNTNNYDLATTTYNFTNQPTSVTRQHYNSSSTAYPQLTAISTYQYDQLGCKLKTSEQLQYGNNTATPKTLISQVDYNELGQVLNKHLHSTDSLNFYQNIAYAYNERGWLNTSTAPLFAMQLYYNTGTSKAYNGNIMYQYWGTPGSLNTSYTYAYDKLNRLTSGASSNSYREQSIIYDPMGNMTGLSRIAAGTQIDSLSYSYTGNQLQSISDQSGNSSGLVNGTTYYTWDGNGNELAQTSTTNTQQNKTFTNNLLNLPQTVVANNSGGGSVLTYTYDAAGNKLRRKSTGLNNTTDYISGIQYDGATTPALSFIQTEEGKAVYQTATGGFDYTYYLGDNLGNTRITFDTQSGSAAIQQKDDYYPFGMEISTQPFSPKNEYLYNKKELQEETQQYDYGARYYDPVIARWTTVDPLAEKYRRWSLYNYVEDDPIRLMDPDGMGPTDHIFNSKGQLIKVTPTGHNILIKTDNGQLVRMSNLPSNSKNNQLIANIVGYYGSELGLPRTVFGVGPGGGLAYTDHNENIMLNNKSGHTDRHLDDYYNLLSAEFHEKKHREKHQGETNADNLNHARIYDDQINDKTFARTTDEFKIGIVSSAMTYIEKANNLDKDQTADVEGVIQSINKGIKKYGFEIIEKGTDQTQQKIKLYLKINKKKDE